MIILNITFLVSESAEIEWLKWVYDFHIPFMMQSGFFNSPQVARVLSNENSDGISYAVQFQTDHVEMLEKWNNDYATLFQEHCSKAFTSSDMVYFSTVLEILKP